MRHTLPTVLLSLSLLFYAPIAYASEDIIIVEEHISPEKQAMQKLAEIKAAAANKDSRSVHVMAAEKYGSKIGVSRVSVEMAHAAMLNNKGEITGLASFWQGNKGLVIKLYVEGLTSGTHGLHIHEHGKCAAMDKFMSAKGHAKHENEKSHGFMHHEGPHLGDLPNIIVDEGGVAHAEFYSERLRLHYSKEHQHMFALLDGAAIMIHAAADDYVSQPIGGSGARVSCGVVQQ